LGGEVFGSGAFVGVARKHRQEVAGGVFHVYARGNAGRRIYLDDVDRRLYLTLLGHVVATKRWRCLAYCLMDNHVHLVVETPETNLSDGMQLLHGIYAQKHNARYRSGGHLFQGRFGAVHVRSDPHLMAVLAYVARNPVEAGLCRHAGDWRWGSHAAVLANARPRWLDVRRLLHYFDVGGNPARRYAELVEAGVRV
jgi:putative transposase